MSISKFLRAYVELEGFTSGELLVEDPSSVSVEPSHFLAFTIM